MQQILKTVKKFLANKSGNFAVTASLIAVPLMASGGYALDYTIMNQQYAALQDAADAAALASVKELISLSFGSVSEIDLWAKSIIC